MDEVSLGAPTMVGELVDGEIREYDIHPEDFGLQMVSSRNLRVSGAEESREKVLEVLNNVSGAAKDIVSLNAGAALYGAGVASSIADGVKKAQEAIASGAAVPRWITSFRSLSNSESKLCRTYLTTSWQSKKMRLLQQKNISH
jgi:anthranilate phosphoribosyltransferase